MTTAAERLLMLDSMTEATRRSHGHDSKAAVKCDACSRMVSVFIWWLEEHRSEVT